MVQTKEFACPSPHGLAAAAPCWNRVSASWSFSRWSWAPSTSASSCFIHQALVERARWAAALWRRQLYRQHRYQLPRRAAMRRAPSVGLDDVHSRIEMLYYSSTAGSRGYFGLTSAMVHGNHTCPSRRRQRTSPCRPTRRTPICSVQDPDHAITSTTKCSLCFPARILLRDPTSTRRFRRANSGLPDAASDLSDLITC